MKIFRNNKPQTVNPNPAPATRPEPAQGMKIHRHSNYQPPTREDDSRGLRAQKDRKKEFFDRTEQFCNKLIAEMAAGDSSRLQQMMSFFSSKAAKWSATNIMGLYLQRPSIHRPVTVSEAKALGHWPKKGIRCAEILVPCSAKPTAEKVEEKTDEKQQTPTPADNQEARDKEEAEKAAEGKVEEKTPRRNIFFKVVGCVLDLGYDTEGPALLESEGANEDDALRIHAAARQFAASLGIKDAGENAGDLGLNPFGARTGMLAAGTASMTRQGLQRGISVAQGSLAAGEACKTFVHEIAHHRLHIKDDGSTDVKDPNLRELQAEATAYVVMQHFGIPSDYSATYLQSWGATPKSVMDNLRTICGASREIITGMERELKIGVAIEEVPEEIVEVDEAEFEASFRGNQISVWQAKDPDFSVPEAFDKKGFAKVATISDTNLAEAFSLTQNVEGRWTAGGDTRVSVHLKSARSSSVGDVLEVGVGEFHAISSMGFEQIPDLEQGAKVSA